MKVYDLFSKRNSLKTPGDVYLYDQLPNKLRVQIVHIINDAFGAGSDHEKVEAFQEMHDVICREEGIFRLANHPQGPINDLLNYFLQIDSFEKALDVVEICFRVLPALFKESYIIQMHANIKPAEAIEELNHRFKESGVGFQFAGDRIIKLTDEFSHNEIVRPVLALLSAQKYKNINDEFMSAHVHYRNGKYKECLVDCLKSFESTLKVICKQKKWPYKDTDTAQTLIKTVFDNKLIPDFMQSNIGALRSVLESGIPTIRNRLGGHGQGDKTIEVDEYVAKYTINLAGSTILMLLEAAK